MRPPKTVFEGGPVRQRRASEDPVSYQDRSFIIDVEKTKLELLKQEDTDQNFQITVQDGGTPCLSSSHLLFLKRSKNISFGLVE